MRGFSITTVCLALAWLLLAPDPLGAWGPATHVALGEVLLDSLYLLPPALRLLLEAFPIQFLYGSVAADISFAKKYVPEGRHSHNWQFGHAGQRSDAIRRTKPVHHRKLEIHQNDIVRTPLDGCHGRQSIVHGLRDMAAPAQHAGRDRPIDGVVFDDEDSEALP